jgi:hypothetical protein
VHEHAARRGLRERERRAVREAAVDLGFAPAQCVDLVFKVSYGSMLYMGELGHFTLTWPNLP